MRLHLAFFRKPASRLADEGSSSEQVSRRPNAHGPAELSSLWRRFFGASPEYPAAPGSTNKLGDRCAIWEDFSHLLEPISPEPRQEPCQHCPVQDSEYDPVDGTTELMHVLFTGEVEYLHRDAHQSVAHPGQVGHPVFAFAGDKRRTDKSRRHEDHEPDGRQKCSVGAFEIRPCPP